MGRTEVATVAVLLSRIGSKISDESISAVTLITSVPTAWSGAKIRVTTMVAVSPASRVAMRHLRSPNSLKTELGEVTLLTKVKPGVIPEPLKETTTLSVSLLPRLPARWEHVDGGGGENHGELIPGLDGEGLDRAGFYQHCQHEVSGGKEDFRLSTEQGDRPNFTVD